MKGGLHHPPPLPVTRFIAGEESVPYEFPQERGPAVADKFVLIRNEDLLDDFRIVDKADALVENAEPRDRAIGLCGALEKGYRTADGTAAEETVCVEPSRTWRQ